MPSSDSPHHTRSDEKLVRMKEEFASRCHPKGVCEIQLTLQLTNAAISFSVTTSRLPTQQTPFCFADEGMKLFEKNNEPIKKIAQTDKMIFRKMATDSQIDKSRYIHPEKENYIVL